MFFKLVKNDFKYYSRKFMAVIIVSLIGGMLFAVSKSTFKTSDMWGDASHEISGLVFVCMIFVALIYATIVTIGIFNDKFISNESYLTFSLPVKKYQHLLSNIILALFWEVAIIITEILIMLSFKPCREYLILPGFEQFINLFKASPGAAILTIIHCGFISANIISLVYLCCTLSNITYLKRLPKVVGIVLFSIFMVLEIRTMFLLPEGKHRILTDHGTLYFASHILFHLVYSLAWYFLNIYLLEKKLEVD